MPMLRPEILSLLASQTTRTLPPRPGDDLHQSPKPARWQHWVLLLLALFATGASLVTVRRACRFELPRRRGNLMALAADRGDQAILARADRCRLSDARDPIEQIAGASLHIESVDCITNVGPEIPARLGLTGALNQPASLRFRE
jgi:hypothetical protein